MEGSVHLDIFKDIKLIEQLPVKVENIEKINNMVERLMKVYRISMDNVKL